ncbi:MULTISPECIES: EscI/YscI/HrpB family type III secretion system inner rod protein [unclassified Sinorhizobium]|uniref:EscI/YscI/HrpB family type III secretion system inner rod protein n=1 Tax=unclassified Sinorhizobium TaxID=2613772 RepID=UPI0024C37414|nr:MULTISPECIES: EscI/YscI/HrpB family type III secretion system inner rod protein [unclassified Sinorhizobium]MDK1378205.1 EscI/YscI/HrpB family type III secretion system inner rod protein [Sinorhizobium sp. 6-70]MDK1482731.1 EscI/YscI/HrpB family type III secretion system inner rod protein [Sinorhizobium sp. 6-117]
MSSVHKIFSQTLPAKLMADTSAASILPAESIEAFRAALERPEALERDNALLITAGDGSKEKGRGPDVVRTPDGMLGGMENLSTSLTHAVDATRRATERLNPGEIRSADWLRAQLALSAMTLQYGVAAKMVGKATESLDTFLKSQ